MKNNEYNWLNESHDENYNNQEYYNIETRKDYEKVYNKNKPIRLQDSYLQNFSPTLIESQIIDYIEIDGIKTDIYRNAYAYNYYYGWIDLKTPENDKKYNVNKEIHNTKRLTNTLAINIIPYILIIALIVETNTRLEDYHSVIVISGVFSYFFIAIAILALGKEKRKQKIEEIYHNGRRAKEPKELREARLDNNLKIPYNKPIKEDKLDRFLRYYR